MIQIILIAIGGAIGALARHGMNGLVIRLMGNDFPYYTLIVNVIGCLLIGVFMSMLSLAQGSNDHIRAFINIGLLGAFTTFSAFSMDAITLINRGALLEAGLYILGNVALGIIAVWFGLTIGRQFV